MANDYTCAILVRDGRMLFGLRAPGRRLYSARWDVFGGRVEAGETIEQALARVKC
jgi:8-oxo-dGTP pyrophosphatase MutT (NUDIX family)